MVMAEDFASVAGIALVDSLFIPMLLVRLITFFARGVSAGYALVSTSGGLRLLRFPGKIILDLNSPFPSSSSCRCRVRAFSRSCKESAPAIAAIPAQPPASWSLPFPPYGRAPDQAKQQQRQNRAYRANDDCQPGNWQHS